MLYVAALLLIPEAEDKPPMVDLGGRSQGVKVAGLVVAGLVGFGVLAAIGAVVGWVLFPLAFLVVAGLLAWWLASGERPAGSPGDILKRAGLGLLLLAACFAIGLGGAYAAGTGGGTVAAVLVIVAGAALVAAAFAGGARWLIMPALALGLSAAFVTAAGINLDGGVGRKEFSPATAADVHPSYKLGVGELVVDLRHTQLAAGDHRLRLQVGVGHALLLVPRGVCVTTTARVGLGGVEVFKHGSGGVDVDLTDGRTAPPGTPRIVLNGDTGVGLLEVRHTRPRNLDNRDKGDGIGEPGNFACTGGARAAAGASAPRG
jgi:hypothetical protein